MMISFRGVLFFNLLLLASLVHSEESVLQRSRTLHRHYLNDQRADLSNRGLFFDFWGWLSSLFGWNNNNPAPAPTPPIDSGFTPIRINCGGDAIDEQGKQWEADRYYNKGLTGYNWLAAWFQGAESPDLFQKYRYEVDLFGQDLEYKIPVPDGSYDVLLYYPSKYNLLGSLSTFDVSIEGSARYNSVAIHDTPDNPSGTKVMTTSSVTVSDGELNIALGAVSSKAYIGAIEILASLEEPLETIAPQPSPTTAPVPPPTKAPTASPTMAPTPTPTRNPTASPSNTPVTVAPATGAPVTNPPVTSPTDAPVTNAPVTSQPTAAPVTPITSAPITVAPVTVAPVTASPTTSPVTSAPVPTPTGFQDIYINAGGDDYEDFLGIVWKSDTPYVTGGGNYSDARFDIDNTEADVLYQTERNGLFQYDIDIPVGNYEIVLHFAELYFEEPLRRVFNVKVEGEEFFSNVDIVDFSGGRYVAATMEGVRTISDGSLTISFENAVPPKNQPKLSGIQVKLVASHLAHAVTGGPYEVVDTLGTGAAVISVDGSQSHTHAPEKDLTQWIWRTGSSIIGNGEQTSFSLAVGTHTVTLTVIDEDGNENTDTTTVTVYGDTYPSISGISPDSGSIGGGLKVTITGTAFNHPASDITVKFGQTELTGGDITVVSSAIIEVFSPAVSLGLPTAVSVVTPVGESLPAVFTYVDDGLPIEFSSLQIERIQSPTVAAWGPDRKLYVGTMNGYIFRVEFLDGGFKIGGWTKVLVAKFRAILGIAFDPMDTSPTPTVYFSHSFFFHGDSNSSSGPAVNGKVSVAKGANLDIIEDVITGLPVSDHDHGVNGLEFGNDGQLYIGIGGNTNAGIPGQLSGSGLQKENVLSASVLVAHLSRPNFDGIITYDADDDGNQSGGLDVEVFAHGLRNPYSIVQHSNGHIYSTDNSPNLNYGDISTSCTTQRKDQVEDDKINLLEKGGYYGHANRKRGETDDRQCEWHSAYDAAGNGYTPPILIMPPSSDGIIEFRSNHFGGQLRRNLIVSQYQGPLYRIILSSDGKSVIPASSPAFPLVGENGLDVVQAPSGELIEIRLEANQIWFHRPIEPPTTNVAVLSVFPYRGGEAGGSTLHVYGKNLNKNGSQVSVTVGGKVCPVTQVKEFRVACTLPGGKGTADVVLTSGSETSVFDDGYHYIRGKE